MHFGPGCLCSRDRIDMDLLTSPVFFLRRGGKLTTKPVHREGGE